MPFVEILAGAALVGLAWSMQLCHKKEQQFKGLSNQCNKITRYYHIFNHWLKLKQQDISCKDYFIENEYHRIAIYGFKELGERLYDELKDSEIEICYIIDKNKDSIWAEIDVFGMDEELPDVDAIVVTPTFFFEEIERELAEKTKCAIVSLEDVIL